MTQMFRFPDLSLGEVESAVLEALWTEGPLSPNAAHALVGEPRSISVNTVSSALKRLYEKGLLRREKVSHAYVYEAAVTRAELQRHLISAIAEQFDDQGGLGLLAAFVDLAQEQGEASLRRLERLVAAKLTQGEP